MMNKNFFFIVFLVVVLSTFTVGVFAANPQITIHVGGAVDGDIVLELYPEEAPITVKNFIDYVRSGFYDDLIFHRTARYSPPNSYISVIQGGGFYVEDSNLVPRTSSGSIINESTNGLSNLAGTIAMARLGHPHSATSEFFINQTDNTNLDFGGLVQDPAGNFYYQPGYCVFGEVISGINFVNSIHALLTTPEADGRPNEDVTIVSAIVTLEAPYCTEELKGDVDGDCDVDVEDVMRFSVQWLNPKCEGCYSADFSGDGEVNFADYAKIAENWLSCTSITTPCN